MTDDKTPARPSLPNRLPYVAGAAALVVVAGLSLFIVGQRGEEDSSASNAGQEGAAPLAEPPAGMATLFYVAADGMSLVAREQPLAVDAGTNDLERARIIIEQQLAGAPLPL